jgi:hypothetical protein
MGFVIDDVEFPGCECQCSHRDLLFDVREKKGGGLGFEGQLTAIRSIDTISMAIYAVCLAVAIFDGGTHCHRLCSAIVWYNLDLKWSRGSRRIQARKILICGELKDELS